MNRKSFLSTIIAGGAGGTVALFALCSAFFVATRGMPEALRAYLAFSAAVLPFGWFIGTVAGSVAALWNMDVEKPKGAVLWALAVILGGSWMLNELARALLGLVAR